MYLTGHMTLCMHCGALWLCVHIPALTSCGLCGSDDPVPDSVRSQLSL